MQQHHSRHQYIVNHLLILSLVVIILVVAQPVLIPVVFGIFISVLFEPVGRKLENMGLGRLWSTILIFLVLFIVIGAVIMLFSTQILTAVNDAFESGTSAIDGFLSKVEEQTGMTKAGIRNWFENNWKKLMNGQIISAFGSIASSMNLLFSIGMSFIYAFLFLIYRIAIRNFILSRFAFDEREKVKDVMGKIVKVVQQYLVGLGIMVAILCTLNSLGLWIVGIENPVLWGVVAGILAVIPYIGNLLGASFPFLQSLVSSGPAWHPLGVVAVFVIVQQLEGNFITPKLIGNKVNINPLTAIFSLIVGAAIWGIPGMILAIPLAAIIKIILDHTDKYQAVGLLMGDHLRANRSKFLEEYDQDHHQVFEQHKENS